MPTEHSATAGPPTGRKTGLIATVFPPVMLAVAVLFTFGWLAAVLVLAVGVAFSWWLVSFLDARRGPDRRPGSGGRDEATGHGEHPEQR